MVQRRQLYGLGVEANVALAALEHLPHAQHIDVRIELGDASLRRADEIGDDLYISEERDEQGRPTVHAARLHGSGAVRIAYIDGTVVVIDASASHVWANTPADQTVEDTATYLLGPVMGAVLRLRGVVCLHASAVEVDGRAVAFVGPAGAGKSSTAAALARAGYAAITDDVLVIDQTDGAYFVRAGYPRVRLWGDSVAALFGSPEALPKLTPNWDKRFLDLAAPGMQFDARPRQLACLYVLVHDTTPSGLPEVRPLPSPKALLHLIGNSFATHYQDKAGRAGELAFLAELCERVPARELVVPRDFSVLAALPGIVSADVRAIGAA